ncbi:MAG: hypothetical protein IJ870_03990 [Alphaproteobacteria bacterium]|nr:hypothetical protein [Alphaproteobacteria bacterium]
MNDHPKKGAKLHFYATRENHENSELFQKNPVKWSIKITKDGKTESLSSIVGKENKLNKGKHFDYSYIYDKEGKNIYIKDLTKDGRNGNVRE